MHKVHCENKRNCPVFLMAADGSRADIPAMSDFRGELDDRQYDAYLALVSNKILIDVPIVSAPKKVAKDVSLRD